MSARADSLAARLEARFGATGARVFTTYEEVTLEVETDRLSSTCQVLRDDPDLGFAQLVDLCGVDYLSYGEAEWTTSERATGTGFSRGVMRGVGAEERVTDERRFAVVYHLLSHRHNERLRLRAYAQGDPPTVASVVEVWSCANWFEREAFDLFGILFEGHPDLRRILTDYGFIGHPFRKDFPLIGHVEMRYDPERGRVVYEPVSIEPRVLVPRVLRQDGFPGHSGEEPSGHA